MEEKISFIHVADLHLDSPFKGLANIPESLFEQLRYSTFQSFEKIVQVAIQKEVDFVLLVGDLFEHEIQSLKAQVFLRDCFEKLAAHDIKVYISYGNHDYISGNRYQLQYPDNVYLFPNENVQTIPFVKEGKTLAHIHGFSYENRVINENKTSEYHIDDRSVPFHIGMLHGSLYGVEGHDPYAPFQVNDLKAKAFDYWALGHIHQRQVISETPPIIYPGNIQGRHRNEAGEKGCYYIQLSKVDTKTEFIPTQHIMFDSQVLDVTTDTSIEDLQANLERTLSIYEYGNSFIQLEIRASEEQNNWEYEKIVKELIALWNEEELAKESFTYIYRYQLSFQTEPAVLMNDLFLKEVDLALHNEEMLDELVRILTNHPQLSLYLDRMDKEEVRKQAKQILIQSLQAREVIS